MLGTTLRRFVLAQARFRAEPLRYVFVLGHMRSGSSLLVHLLASHPEIAGLGESWLRYDSRERFRDLVGWVHAGLRKPFLTERYVLDKILHDDLVDDSTIFHLEAVTSIFLVRDARASLASLFANRARLLGISDWASALGYYERRLTYLADAAESIGDAGRSFFVSYRDLVERPEASLRSMTRFLGLGSPLHPEYAVTSRTGVAGLGDFSEQIRAGRILRTPRVHEVDVPSDVLERGEAAYAACVRTLAPRCTIVED